MTLSLAGRPALSTPGARLACIVSPLRDAAHAETEARIILAASEPQSLYSRSGRLDCTDLCSGWRVPSEDREALAEALEAFVGDDTCAACGEPYPCAVVQNRGAYRPLLVAQHTIKVKE